MLKGNWPGNFCRTVRNEKGGVVKVLEFQPGIPVDLPDEDFDAVKNDIGKSLVPVELDEKGRPRQVDLRSKSEEEAVKENQKKKAEAKEEQDKANAERDARKAGAAKAEAKKK